MFASVSMNRDNLFGGQFGGDCFPGGTVVKKNPSAKQEMWV